MIRSTSTFVSETPVAKDAVSPAAAAGQDRNLALDFTKGILVLFMVLYHWINYFVTSEGFIYRYLRFITPSFIFLTGFLVANVYLAKYAAGDFRLHKRLAVRGAKLIALFTVLNLGARLVWSRNYNGSSLGLGDFLGNLFPIYVIGDGRAAVFEVLVPIGYLLVLSALLLFAGRWQKRAFQLACGLCFAGVFLLAFKGVTIPNLELVAVGLLGVLAGYVPRSALDRMAARTPAILAAYGLYLAAVTYWNVLFILQVVGVCLSLMLMYLLGTRTSGQGLVQSRILVLGRYSLLSYIAQIMILQILLRVLRPMGPGIGTLVVSAVATLGLTQITVELTERGRRQSKVLDRLYRAVFA